jgi:hypothetical protein
VWPRIAEAQTDRGRDSRIVAEWTTEHGD